MSQADQHSTLGTTIEHAPHLPTAGQPAVTREGRPDHANMPTVDLLASFWSYVRDPFADVTTKLVNAMGAGAIQATQGDLQRLAIEAVGLRKAFGRMIARDDAGRDLGFNLPDGLSPSFTLYLQAIGLKPEDNEDRKLSTEFKQQIRKRIRVLRKSATT